jgi:hypothetical protein
MVLFIFLASFSIINCSTFTFPTEEQQTVIVEVPGATQAILFEKAREWYTQSFYSGKAVRDYESGNKDRVIGKGYGALKMAFTGFYRNYFIITINVKPGKAMIRVNPKGYYYEPSKFFLDGLHQNYRVDEKIENLYPEIAEFHSHFKDFMKSTHKKTW